jgi:hypothetical protein
MRVEMSSVVSIIEEALELSNKPLDLLYLLCPEDWYLLTLPDKRLNPGDFKCSVCGRSFEAKDEISLAAVNERQRILFG